MSKHLLVSFFLTFLISNSGFGQSKNINSSQKKNVTNAFKFFDLADAANHADTAMLFMNKACFYCEESGLDSMMMRCHYERGYVWYKKGDYGNAEDDFWKSIKLAEKLKDKSFQFRNYSALGSVKGIQGYTNKGLEYLIKALDLATEVKDSMNIGILNANIGNAYVNLTNTPENRKNAEVFLRKAIRVLKKIDASPGPIIHSYITLSRVVTDKSKKIELIDYALKRSLNAKIDYLIGYCYSVKGDHMSEFKEFQEAITWYSKAADYTKKTGDQNALEVVLLDLMNAQVQMQDFSAAAVTLTEYDQLFDFEDIILGNKVGYLDAVSQILAYQGEFSEAYLLSKRHAEIVDSLSEVELNERYIKYNKEFQLEEKDKEIALQKLSSAKAEAKQDRIVSGIAVGGLILLVLFTILYFRRKKAKALTLNELNKEREMNEFRTTFLENIAHEIRTPITLINGHLTIAKDEISNAKALKQIDSALMSSSKVLANANEILELLKLEKGELPLKKSVITLDSFMRRIFFSFESLAEIKNIQLDYSSNVDGDFCFESDESRIEKIANNFISNAIKFSPKNTFIKCIVNVIEQQLSVSIKDNGPGILKEEQEKIFNRFYQSSKTSTIGGVGVGLSLARDFAVSLNGEVILKSKPNEGAMFTLQIPIQAVGQLKQVKKVFNEKEELVTSEKIDLLSLPKFNILIIEDNPEMNAFLTEILSVHYSCDSAFDGIEGLQKVQTKKYSLIISDVMMPLMDGFELRGKINRLENYKNTPYIFITAKVQLKDKIEGYNLGVDDYITKPFSREELLVRVKNLLTTKTERERWIKDNLEFIGENDATLEDQSLEKMKGIVNDNLSNELFKITDLAEEMGYSTRQLSRITQKLTGMSSVQFVLELRLQKAFICIADKKFATLSEVRHFVGIPTASHFNKKFYERYGKKPSEM